MTLESVDKTSQPRSNEDVLEALGMVEDLMRKPPLNMPMLVLQLGILRDCLYELLDRRGVGKVKG